MKTILYPSSINWSFMFQRPQQLMRAFAQMGYECIFMDKEVNIPGAINRKEPFSPEENLTVLPEHSDLPEFDILYFTYPPPGMQIIHEGFEGLKIFDACDLPEGVFSFWNLGGAWDYCIENSDIILATSHALLERIEDLGKKAIYVPNGVDHNLFAESFVDVVPFPEEFLNIPDPRIVYTGAIATWFDKELAQEIADLRPDYSFIYVGASMNDTFDPQYDNVYILGHKLYERMPQFLYHSDVLHIPFRANDPVIQSTNPVKMWEYLMTGKPLVSTKFREAENVSWGTQLNLGSSVPYIIEKIKDVPIYLANSPEEYVECIDKGLRENYQDHFGGHWTPQEGRRQIAFQNTWFHRAKQIHEEIEKWQP